MNWITTGGSFAKKIKEPRSFFMQNFDESCVREFQQVVNECIKTRQLFLPIHIESPGGYVYSLMGILSAIDYARENGIKICTYVGGVASSCGALLFLYGDQGYRYCGSNSTLMLHNISSGFAGKVDEAKNYFVGVENLESRVFEKISRHIKKPKDWLRKNLEKRKNYDWELTPQECLEAGFANHIKTPTFVMIIEEKFAVV